MSSSYAYTFNDAASMKRAKRLLSKVYLGSRLQTSGIDYSKTRGLTKWLNR